MRLKVSQGERPAHSDICTALGWSVLNELYTCSDDQTIQRWNLSGEHEGKVCGLQCFPTSLHWFPVTSKKQSAGASDLLVLGCTDGERRWLGVLVQCSADASPQLPVSHPSSSLCAARRLVHAQSACGPAAAPSNCPWSQAPTS